VICAFHLQDVISGMIADRIAQIFTDLEAIEVEISKAPPQGNGEKKSQAIRDILYELKGSAVIGEIVRRVK
jgi:hypothetical protein